MIGWTAGLVEYLALGSGRLATTIELWRTGRQRTRSERVQKAVLSLLFEHEPPRARTLTDARVLADRCRGRRRRARGRPSSVMSACVQSIT
jgi:hypothetical protein